MEKQSSKDHIISARSHGLDDALCVPSVSCCGRTSLKVGVIGCGYWGQKHVRVLSGLDEVAELVAVEPEPERRQELRAAFPGLEVVPEVEAALPAVDAVIIATPARTHARLALQALRRGKHVLVEKPLATSLVEARLLVEAARAAGAVLMVGHTFEFDPAIRELRRRIEAGELGTIHYLYSERLNLGLYRPDINVIWDLAPHDVSILSYLLGAPPALVRAWSSSHAFDGVQDLAQARLDYREAGVVGYLHVSWLSPTKVRRLTVVGSRKMAIYDGLAAERLRIFDCGVEVRPNSPGRDGRSLAYRRGGIVAPEIGIEEPLVLEDRHFLACIRDGGTPQSGGVSGLVVVAALEAIDRSLAADRPIELDLSGLRPPPVRRRHEPALQG